MWTGFHAGESHIQETALVATSDAGKFQTGRLLQIKYKTIFHQEKHISVVVFHDMQFKMQIKLQYLLRYFLDAIQKKSEISNP